jgi:hypothetical protein
MILYSFCIISIEKEKNKSFLNSRESKILISASLKDFNLNEKLKREVFLNRIKYNSYSMTESEANILFNILDKDKDDFIDMKDFNDFSILYIKPFEDCNNKKDYLLSLDDFKNCYAKDLKSHDLKFNDYGEEKKEIEKLIMNVISSRENQEINFFEYSIFRRALFTWAKCQGSSRYMKKSNFKCAINKFIYRKYLNKNDCGIIFDTGINYGYGMGQNLDFLSYIRISYFTMAFVYFNNLHPTLELEKIKFLRVVKNNSFLDYFTEKDIEMIYSLNNDQDSMDFPTFAFFFHFNKLFKKHSKKNKDFLNENEYLEMMEDREMLYLIKNNIDKSLKRFTKIEFKKVTPTRKRSNMLSEEKFFSFKQNNTKLEDESSNNKDLNLSAILNNTENFKSNKTDKNKDKKKKDKNNKTDKNENNTTIVNSSENYKQDIVPNEDKNNKTDENENKNKNKKKDKNNDSDKIKKNVYNSDHRVKKKKTIKMKNKKHNNYNKARNTNESKDLNNTEARKYFFSLNSHEDLWDKKSTFKAFIYLKLYNRLMELTSESKNNNLLTDKLPEAYRTTVPSPSSNFRTNSKFYKLLPNEIDIDLLLFFEINVVLNKFENKIFSENPTINESDLKSILKKLGLENIPYDIIETSYSGQDELGRRNFDFSQTFKNLMIAQGLAAMKKN